MREARREAANINMQRIQWFRGHHVDKQINVMMMMMLVVGVVVEPPWSTRNL
jgi:hypothetical protein